MRPAGGLLPFQHNELEFSATRMSALDPGPGRAKTIFDGDLVQYAPWDTS
jgi:hypothetical protein